MNMNQSRRLHGGVAMMLVAASMILAVVITRDGDSDRDPGGAYREVSGRVVPGLDAEGRLAAGREACRALVRGEDITLVGSGVSDRYPVTHDQGRALAELALQLLCPRDPVTGVPFFRS